MAATHFKTFTTTGPAALVTPTAADHKQESLLVVDFISIEGATTTDGVLGLALDDSTNTIYTANSAISAGTTDTVFIAFPDGFPCWKVTASGSDWVSTSAPATSVGIIPIFGDAATGNCTIGYHFERPTNRR